MKHLLIISTLLTFFSLRALSQPKPFEGNVTIAGTAEGQSMDGVAHIKGTHIEVDGKSTMFGPSKLFIDTRLQKVTMVLGTTGMEWNYENDTTNVDPKPNGQHKQIAGYDVQEYVTTSKTGKKTSYWVTTGVPKDQASVIESVLFSSAPPMARRGACLLIGRGYTILRAEYEFTIKGRQLIGGDHGEVERTLSGTAEFVKAEPQTIDDAIFKIPDNLTMMPITEDQEPQDE